MLDFLPHIDIIRLTQIAGYAGIAGIIFSETGLFLGFFLPGDSLLFSAGLLASRGYFNIFWLIILLFVAATAGYWLAYWVGKRLGHWLLKRQDSFWYKKHYLTEAQLFYDRHGGKALIIGRLMPVIRTFLPIAAGMAGMTSTRYFIYNLIGGLIWCTCIPLLGFYLGNIIPNAEHYIFPLVLMIMVVSFIPAAWHLIKFKLKPKVSTGDT